MKKKLLAALLAVCMTASLCACNSEKKDGAGTETTQTVEDSEVTKGGQISTKEYNPDEYVTIGDYNGIEVAVDVYNYTDADVESQFAEEVEYYVDYADMYIYTPTDKTEVEEGDIANINYVGKKDGVAFDGGTAEGYNLEIGSGSFIEGFEDGLIGMKVGESTTLNLTFPEEYQSEELAGAAVTFDVTVNAITERTMPEITDALIQQMELGYDSVATYKEEIKKYLEETCQEENESAKKAAVWNAVYDLCEVKTPPQEMVDDIIVTVKENASSYADYYGVGLEEFVTTYMGYTLEEYEEECKVSAEQSAKQKLTVAAVAKQQGIEITDDELKKLAESEYEEYGYESADALIAGIGKGAYYDYLLSDKVYEYLITCVTIKENAPVSILGDVSDDTLDEEEISEEDVIVLDEEDVDGEGIDLEVEDDQLIDDSIEEDVVEEDSDAEAEEEADVEESEE